MPPPLPPYSLLLVRIVDQIRIDVRTAYVFLVNRGLLIPQLVESMGEVVPIALLFYQLLRFTLDFERERERERERKREWMVEERGRVVEGGGRSGKSEGVGQVEG